MSRLNEAISGPVEEHFLGLILRNLMLDSQLLNDVRQPDEIVNIHEYPSAQTASKYSAW
jgi:hypothetical protein